MTSKPDLTAGSMELSLEYVNQLLGLKLSASEVTGLLEKMRFGVEEKNGRLVVAIPAYRTDILHPIDLVEDVAIAYGYMNFKTEIPKLHSIGQIDKLSEYCETVRDLMVGFGFTEVASLVMTSKNTLFEKMNVEEQDVVETINPVSQEHGVCRNWLLPSLMKTLEFNRNREYPQKIFEVGDVIDADGGDSKKLVAAIAGVDANFSSIKSIADGILQELGLKLDVENHSHTSFIEGRCGKTSYGFYGEIQPKVLENFGLEMPVAALEFTLK